MRSMSQGATASPSTLYEIADYEPRDPAETIRAYEALRAHVEASTGSPFDLSAWDVEVEAGDRTGRAVPALAFRIVVSRADRPGARPSAVSTAEGGALALIRRHYAEMAAFLYEGEPEPLPHVYGHPASRRFPALVARFGEADWDVLDLHVQAFERWLGREVSEEEAEDVAQNVWRVEHEYRMLSAVLRGEGIFIPWRSDNGVYGNLYEYESFKDGDTLGDFRARYEREQAERNRGTRS